MISIFSEKDFSFENKYQCLYFYINDMPFHKKMCSLINKLSDKYEQVTFYFVNCSVIEKSFIKRFGITDVPQLLLFNNGEKILEIKGVVLTSAAKSSFNNVIKISSDI